MKIFEFAKAHNLTSKQVLEAASQLDLITSHASSNLPREEEAKLAAHFQVPLSHATDPVSELTTPANSDEGEFTNETEAGAQNAGSETELASNVWADDGGSCTAASDDAGPETDGTEVDQACPFNGSDIYPRKIYKYAKKRGVTLETVISVGVSLGLFNIHRHREISIEELETLDDHFRSEAEAPSAE